MTLFTKTGKPTKKLTDTVTEILSLEAQIKVLQAQSGSLKTDLKDSIEKTETRSSIQTDTFSVVYKNSTTKIALDTKKFKAEKLAIWKEYSKTSPVASSITIKGK